MQYKYHRHQKFVRSLRVFTTGVGLFLCIELFILLVFNPDHALGEGNIYAHFSLLPFLLVHSLLFSLFLLLDLSAALLLTFGITKPLALLSYLRIVRKVHQEVNKQ